MTSSVVLPPAAIDVPPPATFAPTRVLRVAHVTDFYLPRLGGIERHVCDLARAQREVGHDVDVITAGGRVETNEQPLDLTSRSDGTFASWSPSAIDAAHRAVSVGGYDVVHVHAGIATPLSFSVAAETSRAGLPTVVTMHSMLGGIGSWFRAVDPVVGWRRWPVEWTAVSRTAAADLSRALGERAPVTVLPNAIDVERWRGHRPEPHDDVRIVAVMRLARRKRPMPLLRMLREVRSLVPSDVGLRATIIGDGGSRARMERFLARHGMGSWVELAGRCEHDDIRAIFRAADVFVAPALQESFGIAALEARAAGLPIVAMQHSGIAEFVEHGRSGLLAADDDGMAAAIADLAIDEQRRTAIAAHNRAIAPPFGWDRSVAATSDVYEAAVWRQLVRSVEPVEERLARVGVA